jgi:hypothetical protein
VLCVGSPQRVTAQHRTQIPERDIDLRRWVLQVGHRIEQIAVSHTCAYSARTTSSCSIAPYFPRLAIGTHP